MNLSIDDLEKDLKSILESNGEEVVDGETSVAHNVNAVYDYMQRIILPAVESVSGEDFLFRGQWRYRLKCCRST